MDADPGLYGRSFADVYDRWYADLDPVDRVVDVLARLAAGPRLLELGAGTGRLAGPLSAAGFDVVALDASGAMLDLMQAKALRPAPLPVLGDMAALPVAASTVDVAVVAYNTLFNLTSATTQDACLADVQRALKPGGMLVIDAYMPADPPSSREHHVATSRVDDAELVMILTRQDGRSPLVYGTHMQFTAAGVTTRPWRLFARTPAQLDHAALAIGLDLIHRWSDWNLSAFDPDGTRHVSVYRTQT